MVVSPSSDQLASQLKKDIDAICRGLLAAFEVSFNESDAGLGAATSRWLDFRFRYVEPVPREILLSDRFPKDLPKPIERDFQKLLEKFRSGGDVNPHQSQTLTGYPQLRRHAQHRFRTDMLFADWGMSHFHLDNEPSPTARLYNKRSAWLCFCFVTPSQVAFVDVVPHPDHAGKEFADPDLLNTAMRSWPTAFEHLKARGITPHPVMTMDQIHALRANSTNALFTFNGQAYMSPGGGYMSNKTRMDGYMRLIVLNRDVDTLAKSLNDPSQQFLGEVHGENAAFPTFSMKIHEHGMGIYEHNSRAFFGPSATVEDDAFGLRRMSALLLPRWAMMRVLKLKDTVFDDLLCATALPCA